MVDVAIVGCGIVGMVNALMLAQKSSLSIAILDAKQPELKWSLDDYDPRVYALTPASQQILEDLGLWSQLAAKRISPFRKMSVWESETGAEICFDHAELRVPALGHIVEEKLLRSVLYEKILTMAHIQLFHPVTVSSIEEQEKAIHLSFTTPEPQSLKVKLLIGADGVNSVVRDKAGIALRVTDYHHSSLIAQVETEKPHEETARQRFLSSKTKTPGPLAFLPLKEANTSSIVWSTKPEQVAELMALSEEAFKIRLGEAFDFRLGEILSVSKRYAFPLYERHVEHYVKNRLALIGDAAHSLHPLAGQGLNLGLADAACLAETVLEALHKGRDYSSFATLRRYERARKGANAMMLQAVKILKALFTTEHKGLLLLRTQGLNLTNKLKLAKTFFARYAMG